MGWPPVYMPRRDLAAVQEWVGVRGLAGGLGRAAAPEPRWAARSSVPILEGPSPNKRQIGALKRGDAITAKEMVVTPRDESNGTMDMIWLRHKHGYSCMLFDGKFLMKPYKKKSKKSKKTWKRKGDGKVVTFKFEITKPMGLVMSKRGVVLYVSKKSQALAHGVQAGWQMFAINGKDINNQKTMNERLRKCTRLGTLRSKCLSRHLQTFRPRYRGAGGWYRGRQDQKPQCRTDPKGRRGVESRGPRQECAAAGRRTSAPGIPAACRPQAARRAADASARRRDQPATSRRTVPRGRGRAGPSRIKGRRKGGQAAKIRSGPRAQWKRAGQQLMRPNRDVQTTWTGDSDSSDEELAATLSSADAGALPRPRHDQEGAVLRARGHR